MHGNARLTHKGRQPVVERMKAGTPAATVARQMSVSRATVYKWWGRYRADPDGSWWVDHSSRPRRCPARTGRRAERRILSLRRNKKLGPARIAARLEMPASTVHAVLVRHGVSRLTWMDRPTGRVIRRYEHDRPGDLVHVDIKKLGKIPPAEDGEPMAERPVPPGTTGSATAMSTPPSMTNSRLAYSEIHDDEQAATAVGLLRGPRHQGAGRAER